MNVLLIEPDPLQASMYRAAIQRENHTVAHAVSAQSAIHVADTFAPDVVVLEVQMPGHNGIEFLYEFRSYAEWMDIPVIIYSFMPSRELERSTTLRSELGVKRVLYKPTTALSSLCAAVNQQVATLVS